ncbi:hypothetical protein OJAV_G00200780 [Oryzias javanicus]|uniref:Uncharacterized protein n=1 Tax=Oryzias javanicus TaxID=123683 RepID=A0A437C8Q4_ORYJA|nr:hypothetical protein OJAV_G00200780 [Oryzias javanicus]
MELLSFRQTGPVAVAQPAVRSGDGTCRLFGAPEGAAPRWVSGPRRLPASESLKEPRSAAGALLVFGCLSFFFGV